MNINAAVWLGLFIFFLIIEVISVQLIAVWFALSAFIVFFIAFVTESIALEIFIFLLLSAIFLWMFYFVFKRFYHPQADTNSEGIIGKKGVVIQTIDPKNSCGQVKVAGIEWSVKIKNFDDPVIEAGEQVLIKAIEGVKLVVVRYEEEGR